MPGKVYNIFFEPPEVVEIRAIGLKGRKPGVWEGSAYGQSVVAGYFDNADDFEKTAKRLEACKPPPTGIYFTVNPGSAGLIARSLNRLKASPDVLKQVTADSEIKCLRWLLIDLDPERATGISATDEELEAAATLAGEIKAWLEDEIGFEHGLRAHSGNGYHINYRLPDLPNDDDHRELIKNALKAISHRFSNDAVKVDTTVFNPARIWKLYGTTGRKGDPTKDRPHRQSKLYGDEKNLSDVPVSSLKALKKLASLAPKEGQKGATPTPRPAANVAHRGSPGAGFQQKQQNDLGQLKVDEYLAHYGREVVKVKTDGDKTFYCLAECVFDSNHRGNESSICQTHGPPYLTYQCFHNSCQGRTWADARAIISGSDKIARFYTQYDPAWQPPQRTGSGLLQNGQMMPIAPLTVAADSPVPLPQDMDATEFFIKGSRGPKFVPMLMVNYFQRLLAPIVHTAAIWWRYRDGVWKEFPRTSIFEMGVHALGELAQPNMINSAIDLMAGQVNLEEENWPVQGDFINCKSGMLDLAELVKVDQAKGLEVTKIIKTHAPEYYSRTQIAASFDLDAVCDRWITFLPEVFRDRYDYNENLISKGDGKAQVLREFMGYCMLPDCRYEKVLFLFGDGGNGKGKVLGVIEDIVGDENTAAVSLTELSQRFGATGLLGKMVNAATETTSDLLSTEIFKKAVSGEAIEGEKKYGQKFKFKPYAKFIVSMNDPPIITDKSPAFARRIIVLNFRRRFEEHEMDPDLAGKLAKEKDGIFMWALGGLVSLLKRNRFLPAEDILQDTVEFMESLNPLLIFVNECCELGPDKAVYSTELYRQYTKWCGVGGHRALSRNKFYNQVLVQFTRVQKKPHGLDRRINFVGMEVKTEWE